MISPPVVRADRAAKGGGSSQSPSLTPRMRDTAARRLARLSLILAPTVVVVQLFQRAAQPSLATIIDDPVNRLIALASVLLGIALYALHRFELVSAERLFQFGIVFEVVVAFSISMIETSRPFDPAHPVLGISTLGPWIVFLGLLIPNRPSVTLGIALAVATTWPVAYTLNSWRFGFSTASWALASVWPVMNYMFAALAYLVARRTYPTECQALSAQELGSYRLVAPIGEGGMGEVWRATHQMLARPAAIKLVKPGATGSADLFAARFKREANVIASLQSPHTVYLYDFGTAQDGRLYYVMELLDGLSLETLIGTFGPQPAPRVIAILRQICRSLGEAHGHQFIHRDLKPSNVMLCKVANRFDFVKVLDFGLARPVSADYMSHLTMEGVVTGTPGYMAPEVALGNTSIDGRVDLYSLGCIGYVLLTGTLVFQDSNPMSMALKHVQTPPDRPSIRTELPIPLDLEDIIMKCLEKDPGKRPASADQVARMLEACDVPDWSDDDAAAWWARHLPPTSALRSAGSTTPEKPLAVQKAS